MKRHTNYCLQMDEHEIDHRIITEQNKGLEKFGKFNSPHELYAVLKEELEEFWEGVKKDDPDPMELLQICAVARRGILELCEQSRNEIYKLEDDI